jgi:hypothetical protein
MVTGLTLARTPHVNYMDQEGFVLVVDFSDPENLQSNKTI